MRRSWRGGRDRIQSRQQASRGATQRSVKTGQLGGDGDAGLLLSRLMRQDVTTEDACGDEAQAEGSLTRLLRRTARGSGGDNSSAGTARLQRKPYKARPETGRLGPDATAESHPRSEATATETASISTPELWPVWMNPRRVVVLSLFSFFF